MRHFIISSNKVPYLELTLNIKIHNYNQGIHLEENEELLGAIEARGYSEAIEKIKEKIKQVLLEAS